MTKHKYRHSSGSVHLSMVLIILFPFVAKAQSEPNIENLNRLLTTRNADTSTISKLEQAGEFFLYKPGAFNSDMEMVHRFAEKMENASLQINFLQGVARSKLLHAKAYREAGDTNKGRQICEEAIAIFNVCGTPELQAQALIELGGTYSNSREDLPRKIDLYKRGVTIYHRLGKKSSEAQINEFVGELLQLEGKYAESLTLLQEVLSLYQSQGYSRLHGIYSLMGENYHKQGDFVASLRYNLMAVDVGEKVHETGPLMATVYNRIGINYYGIQYFDQALRYFNKALENARVNKDTSTITTMLENMADAFRGKKMYRQSLHALTTVAKYGKESDGESRLQEYITYLKNYLALKEYHNAEPYYKKLLAIYQQHKLSISITQVVRLTLVDYLQETGHFDETLPLFRSFEQDKKLAPISLNRRIESEYLFFRTDSALGNLSSAINHYQAYKMLSDSLTSLSQARQLGVLQLQFETEQKDKNIELLTQKSKLQEVSLHEERTFRNVFVVGVGMLLIFSALMYNRYRLKKRSNMDLEKKQKEINEQNQVLKKLLDEKEWLVKEVHHRVKNNLQIVISLLNTQSEYLDNGDAIAAIRNSQHRMYAMSLIHQRLYQVENLGKIDMEWYVRELINYMKDSFEGTNNIQFIVNTTSICLDSSQAVPVGLIINEAVTNAVKYAFPRGRRGCIDVSLLPATEGNCLLCIMDNGVGLPDGYDVTESSSLGMSLMHGLADQLEGTLHVSSDNRGVCITLDFRCRFLNSDTNEIN
ncbi:histidine kinase dimerization/phosphoacceptor domain -containing protein [Chitinophagaceae bacterium 26-R-25]|nr:histidine kinase dimerization/phosphoacceptor domain -containing protein [Chitinophagaceae bacterium 26-R-25]